MKTSVIQAAIVVGPSGMEDVVMGSRTDCGIHKRTLSASANQNLNSEMISDNSAGRTSTDTDHTYVRNTAIGRDDRTTGSQELWVVLHDPPQQRDSSCWCRRPAVKTPRAPTSGSPRCVPSPSSVTDVVVVVWSCAHERCPDIFKGKGLVVQLRGDVTAGSVSGDCP